MLRRQLAPASKGAMEAIDAEVRSSLHALLAGRQVVDVVGPAGPTQGALNLGTLDTIDSGMDGVAAALRRVQALVEVRVPFTVDQMVLDTIDRGARPDLQAAADAAARVAACEDRAIFHGWKEAGIQGIMQASTHDAVALPDDLEQLPKAVAEAVATLRTEGIEGPFWLVLGTAPFRASGSANVDGYPVRKFIEPQLEGGRIIHAPSVDGGVVMSGRGGDFELTVGQDLSVGYWHHDTKHVEFYITESFTFRVLDDAAAVVLGSKATPRRKQENAMRTTR